MIRSYIGNLPNEIWRMGVWFEFNGKLVLITRKQYENFVQRWMQIATQPPGVDV